MSQNKMSKSILSLNSGIHCQAWTRGKT